MTRDVHRESLSYQPKADKLLGMVVQRAINNLKEGPKEDKVAVASVIAISVVVVLMLAWAIIFFRNIQNVAPVDLSGVLPDTSSQNVQEAQPEPESTYLNIDESSQVPSDSTQIQWQPVDSGGSLEAY